MAARKNDDIPGLPGTEILSLSSRIIELLNGVQQLELEHFSMEIGDLDLFIPSSGLAPVSGLTSPWRTTPLPAQRL
jgi:hypothetical protein